MPLPIAVIAPLNGWRQVGSPNWMKPAMHTFERAPDGQLQHFTDGVLRATIPPEGWDEYAKLWPEAAPLIEQLQLEPAPAGTDPGGGLGDWFD